MLDLYILQGMLLIAIFFVPSYFYFRHRMTSSPGIDHPLNFYTKKRVWHITLMLSGFLLIVTLLSFSLFFSIKYRNNHSTLEFQELLVLALFFGTWLLVAFGFGMYLSGILIEQYTMKELRTYPEFKKLKTALKLFHGPISHVFIYSGGLGMLLVISFLEYFNPIRTTNEFNFIEYIVVGVIFGTIYFLSQIRNKTWKHQMPSFLILLIVDLIYLSLNQNYILNLPFSAFVLTTLITTNSGLLFYRFVYKPAKYDYN